MDISSYLLESIRALPLDTNSTLKFSYFKNVMENYDKNIGELVVFSHGLLAFSTLPKEFTSFWSRYFFGTGEPYRFDGNIVMKKMKIIQDLAALEPNLQYGSIYNSFQMGFGERKNTGDARSSINISMMKDSNTSS